MASDRLHADPFVSFLKSIFHFVEKLAHLLYHTLWHYSIYLLLHVSMINVGSYWWSC
jgi:hypothetical protein